jgi:hypothetical protein
VLDDATSAVDPSVESEILRGLADADLPSTVVVVAYRQGSIALADEVVFVADGAVAARGTHDELLARSRPTATSSPPTRSPRGDDTRPAAGRGSAPRERREPPPTRAPPTDRPHPRGRLAHGRARHLAVPELRVGLPGHPAARAARHRRAGHRADRDPADDRRRARRRTGVDLDAVTAGSSRSPFVAVLVTALASGWMNYRLAAVVETALSSLRVRAFRHIHDLSMLHQATQQRGSLVSRVTSDIDEISRFMQWAGLNLITSVGPAHRRHLVMFVYSWQLTLVVLVVFVPFVVGARWFQRRLTVAYLLVRERVGPCSACWPRPSSVRRSSAPTASRQRTQDRLDERIEDHRGGVRAGTYSSSFSGTGEVFGALATAAAVVAGVLARRRRRGHPRHGARVPVPHHAVRRPGADRRRGDQRGPDRGRRVAAGARRPRPRAGRRRPGRRRPSSCRRARSASASTTSRSATPPRARPPARPPGPSCSTTSTWRSSRGPASRSSARPARARPPSRSC